MQVDPGNLQINAAASFDWARVALCVLTGGAAAWLSSVAAGVRRSLRFGRSAPRDGGPPVVDFRLERDDCRTCVCRNDSRVRCETGFACVNDRYAAHIERFFEENPRVADEWLAHPYFEVRKAAALHANLFRLTALVADPHETVRRAVALRLPQALLRRMSRDPDREVRLRVAERLARRSLVAMLADPDPQVRGMIARRAGADLCVQLEHDPEAIVRAIATARLEDMRARAVEAADEG